MVNLKLGKSLWISKRKLAILVLHNDKSMGMVKSGTLVLLISLFSCETKVDFEFTTINGVPPIVHGCSCIFAKSSDDFKNEKYLFINTGEISILSINGELVVWNPYTDEDPPFTIVTTYTNENRGTRESAELEGKIIITSKEGLVNTFPIFGKCGC